MITRQGQQNLPEDELGRRMIRPDVDRQKRLELTNTFLDQSRVMMQINAYLPTLRQRWVLIASLMLRALMISAYLCICVEDFWGATHPITSAP